MSEHVRASWLLYLNGILVPCISATVSASTGQIPQCTVNLAPSRHLVGVGREDRMRCTVFYLDHYAYDEPTYCLLFDGEVVSARRSVSSSDRSLSLTAVDMMAVLTQFFPHFVSNTSGMVEAELGTANNSVSTAVAPFPRTAVLFNNQIATGEPVRKPFDIYNNIVSLCAGLGVEDDDKPYFLACFHCPGCGSEHPYRIAKPGFSEADIRSKHGGCWKWNGSHA